MLLIEAFKIARTIGKTQYCIGRRTVTFFRFFMIKLSKQQRPHSRSPLRLPARPHPPNLPPPHVTAQTYSPGEPAPAVPAPAQGRAISVVCSSCFLSFDSWIFDIFQIPDSILPYYGHSGKGLNKTADYSCKNARFSMRKLPSAFPVAPPEAARFAP